MFWEFGYLVHYISGRKKEVWCFDSMDEAIGEAACKIQSDRSGRIDLINMVYKEDGVFHLCG